MHPWCYRQILFHSDPAIKHSTEIVLSLILSVSLAKRGDPSLCHLQPSKKSLSLKVLIPTLPMLKCRQLSTTQQLQGTRVYWRSPDGLVWTWAMHRVQSGLSGVFVG